MTYQFNMNNHDSVTRLSLVDKRLFAAIDALNPVDIRQALLDGANVDELDQFGATVIWQLNSQLHSLASAPLEGVGIAHHEVVAIECFELLVKAGADPCASHYDPISEEQNKVCSTREHNCNGCRFFQNQNSQIDDQPTECDRIDFIMVSELMPDGSEFENVWKLCWHQVSNNPNVICDMKVSLELEREMGAHSFPSKPIETI